MFSYISNYLKILIVSCSLLFASNYQYNNLIPEGVYELNYLNVENTGKYEIRIKGNRYLKTNENRKINGKISKYNQLVFLIDNKSSQRIEIQKSELNKDTIKFIVKERKRKKSNIANYLDVGVNYGILIKRGD
jgi:hypothetical protein